MGLVSWRLIRPLRGLARPLQYYSRITTGPYAMFDGIFCESNTVRLALCGSVDGASAPDLVEWMEAVIRQGSTDVVLDLSRVSLLDGSAIGAISFLFRRLTAQGRKLAVEGASGQPLRLLRDLGIATLLGLAAPAAPRRAAAAHFAWALAR